MPRGDRGLGCVWLHPLPSHSATPHRPFPDAGPASRLPPCRRWRRSCLTTTQPPSLCLLGEVGWALAPDSCCSPAHGQETLGWPSLDYPSLDKQVITWLGPWHPSLSIRVPHVYQVLCWTLALSRQDLPPPCLLRTRSVNKQVSRRTWD